MFNGTFACSFFIRVKCIWIISYVNKLFRASDLLIGENLKNEWSDLNIQDQHLLYGTKSEKKNITHYVEKYKYNNKMFYSIKTILTYTVYNDTQLI